MREHTVIHAANAVGLGASLVASAITQSLISKTQVRTLTICPKSWLSEFSNTQNHKFLAHKSFPVKSIDRFFQILGGSFIATERQRIIVLGDMPLFSSVNQVVFVHQAHLLAPRVNEHVSKSVGMHAARFIFKRLCHLPVRYVVQSDCMKTGLIASYAIPPGKIVVAPHPPPRLSFSEAADFTPLPYHANDPLSLIYPAAAYPHKNHPLLAGVIKKLRNVLLHTTLPESVCQKVGYSNINCSNTTPASTDTPLSLFSRAHALVFPSLLESYGLPLVEAMMLGLPIIASDLPYARWVCGDQGIFFNPKSSQDLEAKIIDLRNRMDLGWRPNWTTALKKIHRDWSGIADILCPCINSHKHNRSSVAT